MEINMEKQEKNDRQITVKNLYDLNETIAADLFADVVYPWEVLPRIHDFILEMGATLPADRFEKRGEDIWVAKSAYVAPTACLNGPLIVDEEAEIRHCAFVRGNAIVGKGAVVGNSTELKNVVLFNKVQVPHYNYVGDSVLGFKAHMGAGSITSNVKSDKTLVEVKGCFEGQQFALKTGLKKMGAMLGDNVEIGCNSVLNPGTVIGRESNVYPTSCVRGVIPERHIFKDGEHIVAKQ
jgi:NDP-sugar pyrophosphorylase family protein